MSDYGVLPTGFARKPLVQILKEIELDNVDVFGESLIQTSESPLGQLNGIFSDKVNDIWELGESVYQSFDPNQADGTRLTSIGELRLLQRGSYADTQLRTQINNEGINKFNLRGVEQRIAEVDGLTYLQSFLNDDGSMSGVGLALGDACIAVIGGDDEELADAMVETLPIGGNTYGNTVISSSTESEVSQSFNLLRVTTTRVELNLDLSLQNDRYDLFQPNIQQIVQGFIEEWLKDRINGMDVDEFTIRRIIECKYPNIKLVNFTATVDGGSAQAQGAPVVVAFDKLADIAADDVTAVFV